MTILFDELGVGPVFHGALARANYITPTPIQTLSIPPALAGRDLVATAQTGTGKTAAFGLPLIQRLLEHPVPLKPRSARALILAPTRELAVQINGELRLFAADAKTRIACIYGGVGQFPQVKAVARGVDILVATPGRLLDLVEQGHVRLDTVEIFVLDEADRLLDMGFIRDIRRVVDLLPRRRQTLLYSATMPAEVESLAAAILRDPQRIAIAPKEVTVAKIAQQVLRAEGKDKLNVLEHVLRQDDVSKAIVFTRTKYGADKVAKQLQKRGMEVAVIHGNKSQNERTRALGRFTSGNAWILVATDIAARGIDIDGVSHVVNYELPHEPESYVHRIGRTGRAGAAGAAISLVDNEERKRQKAIEKLIGFALPTSNEHLSAEAVAADEAAAKARAPAAKPGNKRRRRPRTRRSGGDRAPTRARS